MNTLTARKVGFEARGSFRSFTARIPNDGNHQEPGNFRVLRNVAQTVIEEWLLDDGLFTQDEFAAITYCGEMWRRIDDSKERDRTFDLKPLNKICQIKRNFARSDWEIFENVVRWNEPTGVPGSKFSLIRRNSIEAAKMIVKGIAREIYDSGFFKHA